MIISHGAETASEAVRTMPDGEWSASDWLDDDGISHDLIRMAVTVTIDDEKFTVDFGDSDGAVPGPVNMPFGCTLSLAKNVFKSLTTPDTPANHGHYQPLEVVCPPGNLFHAVYPSATYTLWTGMAGFELINKALAQGMAGDPCQFRFRPAGVHGGGHAPAHRPDMYLVSNNEGLGWGATPRPRRGQRPPAPLHHFGPQHLHRGTWSISRLSSTSAWSCDGTRAGRDAGEEGLGSPVR